MSIEKALSQIIGSVLFEAGKTNGSGSKDQPVSQLHAFMSKLPEEDQEMIRHNKEKLNAMLVENPFGDIGVFDPIAYFNEFLNGKETAKTPQPAEDTNHQVVEEAEVDMDTDTDTSFAFYLSGVDTPKAKVIQQLSLMIKTLELQDDDCEIEFNLEIHG